MRVMSRFLAATLACAATAGSAWAQTEIRPDEWSRGTTLGASAGIAVDSAHTGPVFGGAVGWEVSRRFAIEGSGSWLARGDGADAFTGAIKLRTGFFGRRPVDPFIVAGVGLYRASFDPAATRIPRFYERRMGAPPSFRGLGVTFTDPSLVVGGGLNIFLNRHLAIRPDLETTVVLRGGRSHTVTSLAVQAVYHFEEHPVTPRRR